MVFIKKRNNKINNIVFRTDASRKIGSGHLIRNLTLAKELKGKGAEIKFISRKHSSNLNHLICDKGFDVVELYHINTDNKQTNDHGNYNWLGVSELQDAKDTISAIGNSNPDLLIVDNYSIGKDWENYLRSYVKKIMVIDDLANRPHDCDILLDHNWFKNMKTRYDGLVPLGCTKLLGPKYALLRMDFSKIKRRIKPPNDKVKRIFIFFGGSDNFNLTGMTLNALSEPELRHLVVDVMIGDNNPHKDLLRKIAKDRGNVRLHIQVDNVAEIMMKADLAIASGGVNTWERICLGIYSMVITTAENQKPTIQDLSKHNYINFLGDHKKINEDTIRNHINEYISNNNSMKRNQLSIDGLGTHRVANFLINIENY